MKRNSRSQEKLLRETIRLTLLQTTPLIRDVSPKSRMRRIKVKLNEAGLRPRQVFLSEEYVTRVLGVNRRLLSESKFDPRLQGVIAREHLIFEGWWSNVKDTIVKNLKDKLQDNPITSAADAAKELGKNVKGVVVMLTSITASGGDAIDTVVKGSTNLMGKNLSSISKSMKQISNRVKELTKSVKKEAIRRMLEKSAELLENAVGNTVSVIKEVTSGDGWKVMLTTLGCYLATSAIRGKIGQFASSVIKVLSGKPKEMLQGALEIKKQIEELIGESEDEESVDEVEGADDDSALGKAIQIIIGAVKNFVMGFVKKVIGEVGMAAIEQIAGPLAWIKKLGEVFEKVAGGTSWVCEKIMAACERATFKPLGSSASQ